MNRFVPGPDTAHDYRAALGRFATGVTVVTCQSAQGPLGMTVNSFASVSLDPPLVLWSPAKSSSRHNAFVMAERFVVHILGKEQQDTCNQFAKDGLNFHGLEMTTCEGGAPLILGCLAHFECSRYAVHDGGDHTIIVGRVEAAAAKDGKPLVFAGGILGGFAD
ncbi:MAG: flavin reductase family protein [Silicimonas sp.]|nr:flavin reductase family protein [Silicimonas sp.]